ncbi:MAG: hypothetical protein ACM3YE_00865 [Bacteroidota bacterium]
MRINQSISTLFNFRLRSNRSKINMFEGLSQKAAAEFNNLYHKMASENRKLNLRGIYNNRGQLACTPGESDNIWDSNHEKLPDNNNPTFLSPPKSIKQMLLEGPIHLRYTGKLTSTEIAEKWANTGEITPQEQFYLNMVNVHLYEKASQQARIPRMAKKIDQVLLENGITINQDEKFTISVDRNNQITVSGIDDSERSKAIQAALQTHVIKLPYSSCNLAAGIRAVYFGNSQNTNNFSLEVRSLSLATMTASRFLYDETGGKVSLDDLTIIGGAIVGLPPKLADLLNGDNLKGVIRNGQNLEGVRVCIMQVKSYEAKYGKENLPTVISTFTYQNGKLALVEDPELPRKADAISKGQTGSFMERLRFIDNDPQLFYESMAKK